ncbi:MAG: dTDP-4-dehydrorhamnose 3,5-epimerase family protein [Deltaproteobacteria bacterium]|nr:dTDP-4-dehydrorhamnose 3,5-epimerase family protein [Deltaproteobacteria bacterium]
MVNRPEKALKVVYKDEGHLVRGVSSLIAGVHMRRARVIPDERGRLGEIFRCDDPLFEKFGQVYFTTTFPGVIKAWHYHKVQTDWVYVVQGLIKMALYDKREGSPTFGEINELYLGEHCPARVKIPPGVYHGWICVSEREAIIVNVPTEPYNYENPDEYRLHPHDNHIPYLWERRDG